MQKNNFNLYFDSPKSLQNNLKRKFSPLSHSTDNKFLQNFASNENRTLNYKNTFKHSIKTYEGNINHNSTIQNKAHQKQLKNRNNLDVHKKFSFNTFNNKDALLMKLNNKKDSTKNNLNEFNYYSVNANRKVSNSTTNNENINNNNLQILKNNIYKNTSENGLTTLKDVNNNYNYEKQNDKELCIEDIEKNIFLKNQKKKIYLIKKRNDFPISDTSNKSINTKQKNNLYFNNNYNNDSNKNSDINSNSNNNLFYQNFDFNSFNNGFSNNKNKNYQLLQNRNILLNNNCIKFHKKYLNQRNRNKCNILFNSRQNPRTSSEINLKNKKKDLEFQPNNRYNLFKNIIKIDENISMSSSEKNKNIFLNYQNFNYNNNNFSKNNYLSDYYEINQRNSNQEKMQLSTINLPKGQFDNFFINNSDIKVKKLNSMNNFNENLKIQKNNFIFLNSSKNKRINSYEKQNRVNDFAKKENNFNKNYNSSFNNLKVNNTNNFIIFFNSQPNDKEKIPKKKTNNIFLDELEEKSVILPSDDNKTKKQKNGNINKKVSFDDDVITIKYSQKDYIKNLLIFNNKGFVAKHIFFNSKDYIKKIKQNTTIKPIIVKKDIIKERELALEKLNELITECDDEKNSAEQNLKKISVISKKEVKLLKNKEIMSNNKPLRAKLINNDLFENNSNNEKNLLENRRAFSEIIDTNLKPTNIID